MSAAFYAALKAELATDPASIGYSGMTAAQAADALNAAVVTVNRTVIPSYEIINATVPSEWAALSAAEKQRYQTLTGAGQVDASNTNVQASFMAMFAAGTGTRTALVALLTQSVSRVQSILGVAAVTAADVTHARSI